MEFEISFAEDGCFVVKLTGKANAKDCAAYFDRLTAHTQWKPGSLVLSDETELEAGHLTEEDMEAMASVCDQRKGAIGSARIAAFVQSDLVYGMNRMWQVYVEPHWNATVQVFKSKAEAMAWLFK